MSRSQSHPTAAFAICLVVISIIVVFDLWISGEWMSGGGLSNGGLLAGQPSGGDINKEVSGSFKDSALDASRTSLDLLGIAIFLAGSMRLAVSLQMLLMAKILRSKLDWKRM